MTNFKSYSWEQFFTPFFLDDNEAVFSSLVYVCSDLNDHTREQGWMKTSKKKKRKILGQYTIKKEEN